MTKVGLPVASAFMQSSSGVSVIYRNLLLPQSHQSPQVPIGSHEVNYKPLENVQIVSITEKKPDKAIL